MGCHFLLQNQPYFNFKKISVLVRKASEAAPTGSSPLEQAPRVSTISSEGRARQRPFVTNRKRSDHPVFHLRVTSREAGKAAVRLCPQRKQSQPWTLRPWFKASCSVMTANRASQRAHSARLTTVTKVSASVSLSYIRRTRLLST